MSVRPLTYGEQRIANGQPVTSWLMLFGAGQGLLTHLQFNGVALSAAKICPSPVSKITLPLFVVGGAAVGMGVGTYFFGDDQMRRLSQRHAEDVALNTAAQKYEPSQ